MTSQQQQPVIRFRVPHSGFVAELREAAFARRETPSQFIRRAVADRIASTENQGIPDDS